MNKKTALRTLKMQLTTQESEMANYLEGLGYGA